MAEQPKSNARKEDLRHLEHWELVHSRASVESRSWFQVKPEASLRLIQLAAPEKDAAIIDVGGGASTLVDHLAQEGYQDLTVLDISATALRTSQARLANPVRGIKWIERDILHFEPKRHYDLWHDRALFHFMVSERHRAAYRAVLERALAPEGHIVIATFAMDGPESCSGLPVRRYDAARLLEALGEEFVVRSEARDEHLTPGGELQAFSYFLLQRR
jgi:2-polyprenyl-3-methyl-5-hydroxy-6-metoxy-1,4-benzoquinol methylase